MVHPEPCKELGRRIFAAISGWDRPLLTFIYLGFEPVAQLVASKAAPCAEGGLRSGRLPPRVKPPADRGRPASWSASWGPGHLKGAAVDVGEEGVVEDHLSRSL